MATVDEVISAYFAAWNEPDDAARHRLIDVCWADDGMLTGPQYQREGRDAVMEHLSGFQRRYPGASVVLTSGLDIHHDLVRYGWRINKADGSLLADGEDVAIIAPDGRIRRVLMFYGPLPPIPTTQ